MWDLIQGKNLGHDHMLITISYVSKENNLRPDKKLSCASKLKSLIFILQSPANSH